MPREEEMEQGRTGKMDLGVEEMDQGMEQQGWSVASLLGIPPVSWCGEELARASPDRWQRCSQGRTVQGRWIKITAAQGEERARFTSLHTVN